MKIVFDVNTPAPLAKALRGHEVVLSNTLGWQRLKNGVLLASAEESGFDLLITCDQSIPYQQNLAGRKIAVLILTANNWPRLRPVVAKIASAVDAIGPGEVVRLDVSALVAGNG